MININDFKSTYRWYVSGSPFSTTEMIYCCMNFLGYSHRGDPKLIDFMLQNIYWRNTIKLIGNQLNIPDYVQEVLFMEPTEIERALFVSVDRLHMRKLCCHPQVSLKDRLILGETKKPLSKIRENMLFHINQKIKEYSIEVENYEKELLKYNPLFIELEEKIQNQQNHKGNLENLKQEKKELKKQIEQIQRSIHNSKQCLTSQRKRFNYLDNAIPLTLQNITDPCTICYEFQPENMAILTCGHMMCYGCTIGVISHSKCCPLCRKPITKNDVTRIASEKQIKEITNQNELNSLIEKNGTKMGHLVYYIRQQIQKESNDIPCRFIVFSQWDEMLQLIGKTLSENGIQNVFVNGNTNSKNDAIFKFQSDKDVRVIMLSLKNAASGTNLTQATHVIFTDPVDGTKAQRAALDQQAIARAHRIGQTVQVTVVQMILKSTIEQEIYDQYYKSDALRDDNNLDDPEILEDNEDDDVDQEFDENIDVD